jgi:ABC-type Fe3+/spermidine/putrescine transport system ATPase subunit
MTAIRVADVEMRFGNFVALKSMSFDVQEGEFVTLLGPSGCGKTTLLKLISGFLQPTSGRIEINGEDVTGVPPEKRDTALCFQSYALFPHLTVEENLLFGLRQQKLTAADRDARLTQVVDQVDLREHLPKLPNQLSGGQQQRVALGRALAMRPSVILFDEPLSNLDAKLRESVRYEIRKIQREYNLTAIYVTHDQYEALAMSDRVFIMNGGVVEQSGVPEEIYSRPRTSFVADFIGSANILDAEIVAENGGDHWEVQTALGALTIGSSTPPPAKKVRICWRPERVTLGPGATNTVSAQVTNRSFQGNFTDILFASGDVSQRLQLNRVNINEGERIEFHIDPKDISFLEAVS